MQQWLVEHSQPPRAIERFWRQVLVSAISEELDRTAAAHGFQVFRLAFLATSNAYEMGVPAVPLGELYRSDAWAKIGDVSDAAARAGGRDQHPGRRGAVHSRAAASAIAPISTSARCRSNGWPALDIPVDVSGFTHAPITSIHLWFDRPVIDIPQATLLDRTIQWIFNKSEGRYVQLVVSASHTLIETPRAEVIGARAARAGRIFPGDAGCSRGEGARGERNSRGVVASARARIAPAAGERRRFAICFWRAIGLVTAGRRSWKARCAAVIWRRKR